MRKSLAFIVALAMSIFIVPALPATAAIVKTTVQISSPKYVFAGVPNPIDVAVCPKTSLNTTTCELGVERVVTLWANGKKVQTVRTIGGGGVAVFAWTPKTVGSTNLRATVAGSGILRSASSESKKISVKAKSKPSSLGTRSCGTVCVQGIPAKLDLNISSQVITAGITSGSTKSRKVRFQSLRVSNQYQDEYSATSVWQSDINKYGIAFEFANVWNTTESDCTPGDTIRRNYRFYLDATSTSPAAATKANWIDVVCPDGDEPYGDIEVEVNYSDQVIDYLYDSPEPVQVSVTAPEDSQYSIYSEYCLKDSDCTDYDNWEWMDYYTRDDDIFGSRDFELSMDPGDVGSYWVRVHVVPWTDQEEIFSDWYSLTLY